MRIGIDLGGTKIEGVLLDGSRDAARMRVPTPRGDYAGTLDAIRDVIAHLESGLRAPVSVGLGIPGAIDPDTGLIKNANSVWLIGKPLLRDLEAVLARPIRIANDANCFVVSEAADGAGAGAPVVFGVIVGTGTGAGIVVHGRLLTGRHAIAGEWGHNPLPWPDDGEWSPPACYCGRTGCIELFLSGPGMARDHESRTGIRTAPADLVRRAALHDPDAETTLVRYERRMARALAAIINVLDPDVIVLGGGLSNIDRLYVNVPKLWDAFVFGATHAPTEPRDAASSAAPPAVVRTRLVRAAHGDASGVRGAARLWPEP